MIMHSKRGCDTGRARDSKMINGYSEHTEDDRTSLMDGSMTTLSASDFLPTILLPRTNKLVAGYLSKKQRGEF